MYRDYIRELNEVLSTKCLPYIHLVNSLYYTKPSLFCDNYDKMRGHIITSNTHSLRTISLSSSECDEDYTTRVQRESNNMVEDDLVVMSNNPRLEYATPSSQPC